MPPGRHEKSLMYKVFFTKIKKIHSALRSLSKKYMDNLNKTSLFFHFLVGVSKCIQNVISPFI